MATEERATDAVKQETTGPAKRRAKRRRVLRAKVHVQCTYNNTIVSAADTDGNVIAWSSAGRIGYGGARKATPYAAQAVIRDLIHRMEPFQVREASVEVRGLGNARESALRTLAAQSTFSVTSIRDVTPMPHNGCRPPKRRRV